MKRIAKLLSCLSAFFVFGSIPALPVQAEASAYTFTARDIQRNLNERNWAYICDVDEERIIETKGDGTKYHRCDDAATCVASTLGGIAFVWHGEGTPQGEKIGGCETEWSEGYVGFKKGETPKIGTAEGFLSAYGIIDPVAANARDYSWTEPTEITQYPETIYLAGAESVNGKTDSGDGVNDCSKMADALMADERVEVIGLIYGMNRRPLYWEYQPDYVYMDVPESWHGGMFWDDMLFGHNFTAELVPIQHYESVRGDLSNDGKIRLEDVLSAAELYHNSLLDVAQPTPEQLETADINGDCSIDLTDLLAILQYYNYNEILGVAVAWEDILANKA